MNHWPKIAFFALVVRPLALFVLGLNVRRRELLPTQGPAVIVANHNSHLDTLVLMSLYPLGRIPRLRPVAAADYFLRNRLVAWFALNLLGILPLERKPRAGEAHPLEGAMAALDRGEILILFPEGSRGDPERLAHFKTGVAHLAKARPQVPIHPVFLHGLGKALPKGEALLVPFICDVFVGEPLMWGGERGGFMEELQRRVDQLAQEGGFSDYPV